MIASRRLLGVVAALVAASMAPIVIASADSPSKVSRYIASSTAIARLPSNASPPLSSLSTANIQYLQGSNMLANRCNPKKDARDASNPVPCWFGDLHSPTTIVLYGDSNAGNWIPTLNIDMKLLKVRLAAFVYPSCATPFIPEANVGTGFWPIPFEGKIDGPVFQECASWHSHVVAAVRALKPAAIIAVSGPWMYSPTAADLHEWVNGFATMFTDMTKGRPSTTRIVLGTSPIMPFPVPACLAAYPTAIQHCGAHFKVGTGYYGGMLARDNEVATASKAHLIPTTPLFCTRNRCSPVIKNYIVYVDLDHTSIAYTTYLAGLMYNTLAPVLRSAKAN